MLKHLSLAAAAVGLFALSAHAQLVVANDQSGTASIYNIDVTTGVATVIYSGTGAEAKAWGMAYDGATDTLYWNNGGTLYSSPMGPTLTPVALGGLTFNGGTINYVALAFKNGKLYGTRNISTEAIYEIDPVTRDAVQVWIHPSTFDFGGLEYDATNGKLYGLTDTAPTPSVRGLYEIDPIAQTTTFISGYPGTESDIDGLAVHNGLAYYVSDGPNTTQVNFYVYDVATGLQVGTLPSPFTGSGTFSAATFVANAGTPVTPYCFGDGSGTACPCGNTGATGNGCASSVNPNGGNLNGSGAASIANDTFTLSGTGMPNNSALYFQGTTQLNGGNGVVFGDGLRCVGGTIIRLGTRSNIAGASQFPDVGTPLISVKGNNIAGGTRHYQTWYRNPASFCTADPFNLTNGLSVTWTP